MPNPVVHWEITGPNGKALQEFYGKLFDWKVDVQEEMGGYGMVEPQGAGIGGGISEGEDGVTIYVEVPDLDAYLAKVAQLGGRTVTPPTEVPGVVTFATFADPGGHIVGLVKSDAG